MREIRLYGSEGGGAGYSPYPYHPTDGNYWIPAFAGLTVGRTGQSHRSAAVHHYHLPSHKPPIGGHGKRDLGDVFRSSDPL